MNFSLEKNKAVIFSSLFGLFLYSNLALIVNYEANFQIENPCQVNQISDNGNSSVCQVPTYSAIAVQRISSNTTQQAIPAEIRRVVFKTDFFDYSVNNKSPPYV